MKKILDFFVNNIIIFILILSTLAYFYPQGFVWMTKYTAIFLGVAMFGMGTNINLKSLKSILVRPKEISIGIIAQFVIMPLIAWALTVILNLPTEIAIGVILVGCCPGGTASNVITHIAGGDVTLSVTMTTISTLVAPILTPLLVYLLAGQKIEVSLVAMFITVVKVILIPVILGIIVNSILGKNMRRISPILPAISSLAIVLIISGIIALNAQKLLSSGFMVILVIFLHNIIGLLAGWLIAKAFKFNNKKSTAIAIEVGMQNSGLAVSLATINFATNPLATLPGAVFSVMHNITGSLFANIVKRLNDREVE